MVAAAVAAGEIGDTPSYTSVAPKPLGLNQKYFDSTFAEAVMPHNRVVCSLGDLSVTCLFPRPGFDSSLESAEEEP